MSEATERVLERLAALDFAVRPGGLAPFGEDLPLVTGVAWDTGTAQLALIAEMSSEDSDEAWCQLLFAGSGLRHQLAGDAPAGFGTPIVLAIVDDDAERRLRELTEDLALRYVLFNRVDLNLVRRRALADDEALDLALAPLLPKCRALLGQEISRGEVQRFWDVLRQEVHHAALGLDDLFGPFRDAAGREIAAALIADSADADELPAPGPISSVTLQNFRSFIDQTIELAPVSVIHGPNGGGKTSVVEGLELVWAGRSQRQPDDVNAGEYERHLPRDGLGTFVVQGDDDVVTGVATAPRAELGRCVLGQDLVADLVSSAPRARYEALLASTGLEIPDLKMRTAELVASAKKEADAALLAAGLPPLRRSDADARKHLVTSLSSDFARRLPSAADLVALEQTLVQVAAGSFVPRAWEDEAAATALARADAEVDGVLGDVDGDGGAVTEALDEACTAVHAMATGRHEAARAARALLDAINQELVARPDASEGAGPAEEVEVPAGLAVRWLSHSRGLVDAAARFRSEADALAEPWSARLAAYADALERAAEATPREELEPLARVVPRLPSPGTAVVAQAAYHAAGFSNAPPQAQVILVPLGELAVELQRQADAILALGAELAQHPARRFAEHAPRVLRAVCRFELARTLRREGPVLRASEQLIRQLLQGRLAPVLRELVAAIVRFEWYFKPLQVPDNGRSVVLGGLSTSHPDLDARLVLNAAERTVVGVAWFLALHLLQPADRRRVLVLDDPTGAFDIVNQAGFISTLRAFTRLTRPEQLVVTTHDDSLAAVLAEELAPVDAWPSATTRVRCQRDGNDASTARTDWTLATARKTAEESVMLGLQGEPTLFA